MSIENGHVNDAGEVLVWPSRETLAQSRGVSVPALAAQLKELERCGAIRREPLPVRRKVTDMWVRAVPHLIALLMQDERTRTDMEERFPDSVKGKVVSMTEFIHRRHDEPARQFASEDEVDNAIVMEIRQGKMTTSRNMTLANAVAVGGEKNAVAQARTDARRAAKPPKALKAVAARNLDTPHDLLHMLIACIKGDLKSMYQPAESLENVSKFKALAARIGYTATRQYIEFVTTPANWEALTKRFKLDTPFPTPGMMLGFADTWVPMSMGAVAVEKVKEEKRSGDARPVDLTANGIEKKRGRF